MEGSLALPLSALLSQVLVAHTIEVDGEHERRADDADRRLSVSVVLWHVALRHVPEEGCTAGEIASAGLLSLDPLKVVLGCLERWGHVGLDGDASRAGWGSGRGITRTKALVAQTAAFTADPGSLPHFPVWDGNRGFGP